jgi:dipeptidyl aminopeptidase/acylaminoacyl peptidase
VQTADNKDYVLIYDVTRGTSRRLPSADSAGWPKWSAAGDSLAFTSFAEGKPYRVLTQQMDSDRPPTVIAESADRPTPNTWISGRLSFYEFPGNRMAFVPIAPDGTAAAAQYLSFGGSNHDVSGDGRWIVYADDATSLNIRPLAGGERVRRIAEIGVEPRWCRQCDEIVYRSGNRWYSVRVHVGDDIEWEPPQVVLQTEFVDSPGQSWALSADGQRTLVLQSTGVATRTRMHVMTGWLEN